MSSEITFAISEISPSLQGRKVRTTTEQKGAIPSPGRNRCHSPAGGGLYWDVALIRMRNDPTTHDGWHWLPTLVALMLWCVAGSAQELTPRAYWPAPRGTQVGVVGYAYTDGNIIFDPSVPIYEAETRTNSALLAYLGTFSLFGRSANVIAKLPYAWGETAGLIASESASREFSNFADIGVTFSVNLIGAPSMTVEEFQVFRATPRPLLGMSIEVIAPTGDYSGKRLINTGANRWAIKPEFGFMYPLTGKLLLELEAGVWFFGNDDDFVMGKKEQEPVVTYEAHLVRRFSPGFWMSLDYTYYTGGRQTIDGDELSDNQSNSRLGATLVKPLSRRQVLKLGYATGVRTRFGTDFDQFLLSYQVLLN